MIALSLVALLAGCSYDSDEARRRETVRPWFTDASRPLTITLAPATGSPQLVLIERESVWLETAATMALAGAVAPWLGSAASGNFNLELAIFLTPVFAVGGAIYGAATAEPRETWISDEQIPSAIAVLIGELRPGRLEQALVAQVVAYGNQETDRLWLSRGPSEAVPDASIDSAAGPVISVTLQGVGFVRDDGSNELALTVRGKTYVAEAAGSQPLFWQLWSHESAPNPPRSWAADHEVMLDQAVVQAIGQIAQEIVKSFGEVLGSDAGDG